MLTNVIQLGNVNVCGILESTNSNALKMFFKGIHEMLCPHLICSLGRNKFILYSISCKTFRFLPRLIHIYSSHLEPCYAQV